MCDRNRSFSFVILCVLAVCSQSILLADSYQEVSVTVGGEFTVALADPNTGYGFWSLASPLPSWLELVDETWIADNPDVIGGRGTYYCTFQATAPGSTTLTFEFKYPGNATVLQAHLCQVTAEPPTDKENVHVLVGEEFKISLESNPSTGYTWSLAESLPTWLVLVDKTYIATNPGLPGGGGTEYWTFRATAPGSETLAFRYMQSWVGTPARIHLCRVTAEAQEPNMDGFETGDFSVLAWGYQGTPWQVTSSQPFSGTYCARSGAIGDDGISTLTYTRDCLAGQIGFAVRVSSEPKYDSLSLRIDGQEIAVWSGEQDWMLVSYPVSKGTHTFAWSYEKDKSKSVGEDAAWIDEVTVPEPNIVFVQIPAGTFQMGDSDGSGFSDEQPVHTVTLSAFQMSKYETTNGQYAAYLNAAMASGLIRVVKGIVYTSSDDSLSQPYFDTWSANTYSQIDYRLGQFSVLSRDAKGMANYPVVQVSWYGAKAFCDYYGYRLPTEAEWEYAARGGYHDPYYRYPWGSNIIDCNNANYHSTRGYCNPLGLTSYPYTSPVGHYGPQGAYGLCDMSGNVWEFCQDWYDAGYYSSSPESNPSGPASGTARVLRGGSWSDGGYSVANRYSHSLASRNWGVGFRACR